MKYLIIGGTGNLSDSVVDWLAEKKHSVTCITRGNQDVIEKAKKEIGINFINVDDINQNNKIKKGELDKKYDVVVDFVCYSGIHLKKRFEWIREICSMAYIFISTTAFYKRSTQLVDAYQEDKAIVSKEWDYATSKYETEVILKSLAKNCDFRTIVIRLGHTIGSLIPVNLGNPGHAYIDFLSETNKVPFIGSIDNNWMIGSSKGIYKILDILPNVIESLPHYDVFHYSSAKTTWREIYECLFKTMHIGRPEFIEKEMSTIESITPEWIPSIKYHKIFPDLYDISKIKNIFGELESESIQKIISRAYRSNLMRDKESNYEYNLKRMYKILKA